MIIIIIIIIVIIKIMKRDCWKYQVTPLPILNENNLSIIRIWIVLL